MTQDAVEEEDRIVEVRFNVEGKFVADLARTRVIEGEWQSGLRILTESFHGMTHEDAVSILKGERDLQGWSSDAAGVTMVDLDAQSPEAIEMRERMDWLYGSVFRHRGTYWKPYARVSGWGRPDYEYSRAYVFHANLMDTTRRAESVLYRPELAYRSLYYARDPQRDLLVVVQLGTVEQAEILCERTDMPPLWFDVPNTDIGEHLVARLKARKLRLEPDGYTYRQGFKPPREQSPAEEAPTAREIRDERDELDDEAAEAAYAQSSLGTTNAAPVEDAAERLRRAIARADELANDFELQCKAFKTPEALGAACRAFDRAITELENAFPRGMDDASERRYQLLDAAKAQRYAMLGERVRQQAKHRGGFFKLKLRPTEADRYSGPRFVEVPLHPFVLWSLQHFRFEDFGKQRPEWDLVAGMGLKLPLDDPYHTDWMLGAGLDIDKTYEEKTADGAATLEGLVRDASFSERARLVEEWTGVPFVILAKGTSTYLYGDVVYAKPDQPVVPGCIAIAATAGPEFQLAMESACRPGTNGRPGALICETGGKLAHLAIVGRELSCTVLMVPDALTKYREGQKLSIDIAKGVITLSGT